MVAVSVSLGFSKEPRSIEFHVEVKINRTDLVKKSMGVRSGSAALQKTRPYVTMAATS